MPHRSELNQWISNGLHFLYALAGREHPLRRSTSDFTQLLETIFLSLATLLDLANQLLDLSSLLLNVRWGLQCKVVDGFRMMCELASELRKPLDLLLDICIKDCA